VRQPLIPMNLRITETLIPSCCLLVLLLRLSPQQPHLLVRAFQAPTLGIGAVLFPVRGKVIKGVSVEDNWRSALDDASVFFVDAFWTGKSGGGTKVLTSRQKRSLLQSQYAEFNKRYGGGVSRRSSAKQAELLICRNPKGEVVGVAGVEVDSIPSGSLKGPIEKKAPLMSNLAVSRKYRRRGLAEALVEAVEKQCQDWGFNDCYLYVEKTNPAAVNLYQKLGYRKVWQDGTARTLLPDSTGSLGTQPTVIVCMKKELGLPFWKTIFR